jgi:hypothetical protein
MNYAVTTNLPLRGIILAGEALRFARPRCLMKGGIRVTNFDQGGFLLRNLKDFRINGLYNTGRGDAAPEEPGYHGILVAGCQDGVVENFLIEDASEHGLRVGGTERGELESKELAFINGTVRRSRQCGVKLNAGPTAPALKDISLRNVKSLDSVFGGDTPAYNDFASCCRR